VEAFHLPFQVRDQLESVQAGPMNGPGRQDLVQPLLGVRGEQVGEGHGPREAIRSGRDGCDQVETEQRQVCQVFLVQRLVLQMGMNKADAPKPFCSETVFGQIGDEDVMVRADQDVPDRTGTVDD